MVPRTSALTVLRDAGAPELTLIHAPAGYGKTSLAAQWAEELAGQGVPVAWLSVDADDNVVVWFLANLVCSIEQVLPTIAAEMGRELAVERFALQRLVDRLQGQRQRLVIVLDDLHRVTNSSTLEAVEFLLNNAGGYVQMVVTTRKRAVLPVERLRQRVAIVEIDAQSLRFDHEESHRLLVDHWQLALNDRDVTLVEESTDGWAAALQMASIALQLAPDASAFVAEMPSNSQAISTYLSENVFRTLEPQMLHFLMDTAVPERICAALAAELTDDDETGAAALLSDIEDRDLFVYRLDDGGTWFRYHHMFADELRVRLTRENPQRLIDLHRRAANWFCEHNMTSAAVDHWVSAGDYERAGEVVAAGATEMVEHGRLGSLIGLADKLPLDVQHRRVDLQLALAWSHILLHHGPEGLACMDRAAQLLEMAAPGEVTDDLLAELALLRALIAVFMDLADGIEEPIVRVLSRRRTMRPFCLVAASNIAGYVALQRFDYPGAARWEQWARPLLDRTTGAHAAGYACLVAGQAAHAEGDLDRAETSFRGAIECARRSPDAVTYLTRLFEPLLGEVLYERNQLEEAKQLLDESAALGAEGGIADYLIATFAIGARVDAILGHDPTTKLDAGLEVARQLGMPRLAARLNNERIRLGLNTIAADIAPTQDRMIAVRVDEVELDSYIRELLAAGDFDRAVERALSVVNGLDRKRRPRARLDASLLLTECLLASGRPDMARTRLVPLVNKCAAIGLVRPLIDTGKRVRILVGELERDEVSAQGWALVQQVRKVS